ncbi:MAG: uracil-DNA glycosylase [Prosthecochloris sp.]|uniref:uracil-DNA glycosylase n=1 Tax=Prosthecochloris sp. TaxID=290513 RepID=UPI002582B87C|nr:uracil-DNA glycosylase [Prosthecochloris sp.]MCW8797836.1 uracil-DNA glycosylase [Prosthecochloris sp.]
MQAKLFNDIPQQTPQRDRNNYHSLDELGAQSKNCTQCQLAETRQNVVFGEGNPQAKIVVIGEGPGAEEDAQGRPFVGRSGKLLDKILQSIGFDRNDVYICNIVKCRPPANRNPLAEEIEQCLPWLNAQLELIQPGIILLLGKVAANTILQNKCSMGSMRGSIIRWGTYDVVVTYHPAALLRNPNWKYQCWEDVKMLRKHFDSMYQSNQP